MLDLRTLRRDEGMSLVEVLVASFVVALAGTVFLGVLVVVQNSVARQTERSGNNDQVRLAVQQLDREIRSGNLLYNPSSENPSNFSLRVYSQSNGIARCIQWRIVDRKLQRRSWSPVFGPTAPPASSVSSWRTVAEDIVNRNVSPSVPAFALSGTAASVGRTLDVVILSNGKLESRPTQTARVELSITGRNTTRGTAQDACDPGPAS